MGSFLYFCLSIGTDKSKFWLKCQCLDLNPGYLEAEATVLPKVLRLKFLNQKSFLGLSQIST